MSLHQPVPQKRIARVFIDGANIHYSQRYLGWRIDWHKLKAVLENEFQVLEFHYYTAFRSEDPTMGGFLNFLHHLGFAVTSKAIKIIRLRPGDPEYVEGATNIKYKGNLDVELTVDVLSKTSDVDCVVLMAGDSDFQCLVQRMKDLGKTVVVLSSRRHLARELKQGTEVRFLEDLENSVKKP